MIVEQIALHQDNILLSAYSLSQLPRFNNEDMTPDYLGRPSWSVRRDDLNCPLEVTVTYRRKTTHIVTTDIVERNFRLGKPPKWLVIKENDPEFLTYLYREGFLPTADVLRFGLDVIEISDPDTITPSFDKLVLKFDGYPKSRPFEDEPYRANEFALRTKEEAVIHHISGSQSADDWWRSLAKFKKHILR